MADYDKLTERLREAVGDENVREATGEGQKYAVADVVPALIATPQTPQGVAAAVVAIGMAGAGLVPWGGGTMMGHGHAPEAYDVALMMSGVADIVDFDVANLTVTVQAGMTIAQLQTQLRREKKFLPLFPRMPGHATVGGTVAANANGPGRFLYGSVRDLVLGMRVVLAGGEQLHVGGKTMKNVAGYDLGKMFIGSHGSLGIVTEATFRLLPQPERQASLWVAFGDLRSALELVARALDSELLPASLSVITPLAAEWLLGASPQATALVVDLNGSAETVERQVRQVKELVAGHASVHEVTVVDDAAAELLRDRVHDFVPLGLIGTRQFAFTANLPPAMAGQFVSELELGAAEQGCEVGCLIHGGTGTVSCVVDGTDPMRQIQLYTRAVGLADELGGHCVVEQACVEVRRQVPVWGLPRAEWSMTKLLKHKFDPLGVLNKGRFVGGS